MKETTVYPTIRAARNALALDTGFDPFLSGGWGRCTKRKLALAGYPVDPGECRRREAERKRIEKAKLCAICGEPSMMQLACDRHGIGNCGMCGQPQPTGYCHTHTRYTHMCDYGHRWQETEEESIANGHKCPTCGEHSV